MNPDDIAKRHVFTHPSPVEHWRHLVEIVALVIAGVWGIYVFVYQERIKPASEAPDVQFSLTADHAPAGLNKELITVSPVWHNAGTISAAVDGYILNVYGERYSDEAPHLQIYRDTRPGGYIPSVARIRTPKVERTLLISAFHPWHQLGGYLYGTVLPATNLRGNISVVIPRGRYDTVVAYFSFCFRRKDDNFQIHFQPATGSDGAYAVDSLMLAERQAAPSDRDRFCAIGGPREFAI